MALLKAVENWSGLTNNHHFTTIDIINSGVLDNARGASGRKIPRGFGISFFTVNGGLCELERMGFIKQITDQEQGQMRLWRFNGEATV
tara:strand:- start:701 stop:964 length:264 start_codon:yes stop_codon:yes gene_type:complete